MNREELLSIAPDAFRPQVLPIARGRAVHVRALDAVEMAQARRAAAAAGNTEDFVLWVGLFGVVDAEGRRILTPDDYPAFVRQGYDAHRIGVKVFELSGMGETEADAKKP